jgi:hypothetical protein
MGSYEVTRHKMLPISKFLTHAKSYESSNSVLFFSNLRCKPTIRQILHFVLNSNTIIAASFLKTEFKIQHLKHVFIK